MFREIIISRKSLLELYAMLYTCPVCVLRVYCVCCVRAVCLVHVVCAICAVAGRGGRREEGAGGGEGEEGAHRPQKNKNPALSMCRMRGIVHRCCLYFYHIVNDCSSLLHHFWETKSLDLCVMDCSDWFGVRLFCRTFADTYPTS